MKRFTTFVAVVGCVIGSAALAADFNSIDSNNFCAINCSADSAAPVAAWRVAPVRRLIAARQRWVSARSARWSARLANRAGRFSARGCR